MGMWMQGCTYLCIHSYGHQEQFGYEGVKRIFNPPTPGNWTPAVEPVTKRLVAWAIWPAKKSMTWIQSPVFHLKETHSSWRHHSELMLSLVSAKLPCPPPSLCHKKKKTLPLWVRKALSIFRLKSYNFGACISTCSVHYPTPPTLVHSTKDRFCYL